MSQFSIAAVASAFLNRTILQSSFEEPEKNEILERPRITGKVHMIPRRFSRRYPSRESLAQLEPFGCCPAPVDEYVLGHERLTLVGRTINRLAPEQRRVMRLHLEGMTIAEIMEATGKKRFAVLNLKKRAVVNLQRLVRQRFRH